jgi:hypothetical protein
VTARIKKPIVRMFVLIMARFVIIDRLRD